MLISMTDQHIHLTEMYLFITMAGERKRGGGKGGGVGERGEGGGEREEGRERYTRLVDRHNTADTKNKRYDGEDKCH